MKEWERGHEREIKLANRKGGRQEACNWSCVNMFFLKKVRWMLRCLQDTPYYQESHAPLSLHHYHWSLHIAQWQHWCIDGGWGDCCMNTHTHTHTHTHIHTFLSMHLQSSVRSNRCKCMTQFKSVKVNICSILEEVSMWCDEVSILHIQKHL